MAPTLIDSPIDPVSVKNIPVCSDPLVVPSETAPDTTKKLWWLHGHPHSKRYSNPDLISLAALVRYAGSAYCCQTGFMYPLTSDPYTPYQSMTWDVFDRITESFAASYGKELYEDLQEANRAKKQPTVALLGGGKTLEYFCTQLSLMKLGVRVILLAESNSVKVLHHLLDSCEVTAVITDVKNMGVDTMGIRNFKMIEHLPKISDTARAEVEAVKFKDLGDVWERHTFILHSSGSTGMPKAVVHTNRSMMLIARMYRLFQQFNVKNWFLLFPLYHIAGISVALSGLPNGQILSFPPLSWPPSSSSLFIAWETLAKQNCPVDVVHCAPSLIENMYEFILENGRDFSPLSSLKILQPGGAELSSRIIKDLVANNVNVKTTYGSTEIGPPLRSTPHTKANPKCYSFRNLYPDNDKIKMESIGENAYECVVYKGFELAAQLWDGKLDNEPYRTNDVFTEEPPGSGFFTLKGRKDDILVHTNGENTSAGPLQLDIQVSSKIIKRALAVGHSKPCVGLLVEIGERYNPKDELVEQDVWETIKQVNNSHPAYSRIIRSMIYILPKGRKLPITPKGNVKRAKALKMFESDILQLYSGLDNDPKPNTVEGSQEPLKEYIRNALAILAGVFPGNVKDWTTLYDLGIDSRLALSLRASLSPRMGSLSIGTIFENPSVEKLVAYTQKKGQAVAKVECYQIINRLISKYTSELSAWPKRLPIQPCDRPGSHTVLLTGASGSLGTALLQSLSACPRVSKIYAMVRGPNHKAKLRKSLLNRGLDAHAIFGSNKIEIMNYSMQDILLGLDIAEYAQLAQEVTIVLHNAWKMDFNQGVEYFEDDCIKSTMSLLRLAHAGCPKTFAFTSSISTSLRSRSRTVPETPIGPDPAVALNSGYAHSKYIVERLTQAAAAELRIPVCLLRIGQLCGDSGTGYWNQNEMWPILFASSVVLGAVPDLSGKTVSWLPLDIAARCVVEVLITGRGVGSLVADEGEAEAEIGAEGEAGEEVDGRYVVHNIVNPHHVSWKEVISMLRDSGISAGKELRQVSMAEWVRLLNQANEEGVKADDVPGLRLLRTFEGMAAEEEDREEKGGERGERGGMDDKVFETEGTRRVSPALRDGCTAFCAEWLAANVRRWSESGFLLKL